ncbi:hypothetical protein ABFS82_08G097300 [Erythranthe guttata]
MVVFFSSFNLSLSYLKQSASVTHTDPFSAYSSGENISSLSDGVTAVVLKSSYTTASSNAEQKWRSRRSRHFWRRQPSMLPLLPPTMTPTSPPSRHPTRTMSRTTSFSPAL